MWDAVLAIRSSEKRRMRFSTRSYYSEATLEYIFGRAHCLNYEIAFWVDGIAVVGETV